MLENYLKGGDHRSQNELTEEAVFGVLSVPSTSDNSRLAPKEVTNELNAKTIHVHRLALGL